MYSSYTVTRRDFDKVLRHRKFPDVMVRYGPHLLSVNVFTQSSRILGNIIMHY